MEQSVVATLGHLIATGSRANGVPNVQQRSLVERHSIEASSAFETADRARFPGLFRLGILAAGVTLPWVLLFGAISSR
jgi:hypothetical protein